MCETQAATKLFFVPIYTCEFWSIAIVILISKDFCVSQDEEESLSFNMVVCLDQRIEFKCTYTATGILVTLKYGHPVVSVGICWPQLNKILLVLLLENFDSWTKSYLIEYRKGTQNSNADALSRYPVVNEIAKDDISDCCYIIDNSVLVTEKFIFIISIAEIVSNIKIDKVFSVIYACIPKDINIPQSADFAPYNTARKQLNIDKGWILKANKVVIPKQLGTEVKKTLHKNTWV